MFSIIGVIIALTICGLAFIGNYFFNYALVRVDGIGTAADADLKAQKADELEIERINKEKSQEAVDKCLQVVKTEETTIESEDGLKLWGKIYLQEEPTDKWAIIAHGYTSSSENI